MENLKITSSRRDEVYAELALQLGGLLSDETNLIARLALICSALKQALDFFWVGFYLIDRATNTLVVGPFQGPVACLRIAYGKGVCGAAWSQGKSVSVPDVDQFPGHIACSALSRSELVIPFFVEGELAGVLDIDSTLLNDFTEVDTLGLEKIMRVAGYHKQ